MRRVFSALYVIFVLLFLYLPILFLFVYSFTNAKHISLGMNVFENFTLEPFLNLFETEKLRNIIVDTVVLAIISSIIATALGTLGAIGVFYSKKKIGKLVKSGSQIPVINAEIVTAISLALVFTIVALNNTYASLLIGHVVLSTPFVFLSVLPKLKQMDGSLYEAALDLGATPAQALFKVIIPEIFPGIASGFMLAITLSLDDFMVSAYTKPKEFDTISTYVFSSIKRPQNFPFAELRALSSVIFIVMVIVVLILKFKTEKNNKKIKLGEKK